MRQSLDMETIEDDARRWRRLGHCLDVSLRHVDGDDLQLGVALGAQLGEEELERLGVLAGMSPHHRASVVVDDDGDVLVMPSVRQLVDADVDQAVEGISRSEAGGDAHDDPSHRLPGDPHQRRHARPVTPLCVPTDQLLERLREPRVVPGPWNSLDGDAAESAVHPPEHVAQLQHHSGEVQVPPRALASVIDAACLAAAPRAAGHARRRSYVRHESFLVEEHGENTSLLQLQNLSE